MKTRIAAIAALGLLLTGCAGGTDTDAKSREITQATQAAPDATESAAPLVAETPSAPTMDDTDATFLEYVRDKLLPETQIPNATDEQLIAAGHDACEQLENGTKLEDVRVVDGEKPHANGAYYDTSAIMNAALVTYCPGAA